MRRSLALTTLTAALLGGTVLVPAIAGATTAPRHFANCTAMHKVYPHGVGKPGAVDKGSHKAKGAPVRNTKLYNANSGMDRDHDGIACEA